VLSVFPCSNPQVTHAMRQNTIESYCSSLQGSMKQLMDIRKYSAWVTPASGALLISGGTYTLLSRLLPAWINHTQAYHPYPRWEGCTDMIWVCVLMILSIYVVSTIVGYVLPFLAHTYHEARMIKQCHGVKTCGMRISYRFMGGGWLLSCKPLYLAWSKALWRMLKRSGVSMP